MCIHTLAHICSHTCRFTYTSTHTLAHTCSHTCTLSHTLSCTTHTLSQHSYTFPHTHTQPYTLAHILMNTQAPRTAGTEAESRGVLLSDVAEEVLNPDSGSHFFRPRLCFAQFQSLPIKQQVHCMVRNKTKQTQNYLL